MLLSHVAQPMLGIMVKVLQYARAIHVVAEGVKMHALFQRKHQRAMQTPRRSSTTLSL